jgi:hypothetical protein
MPPRRFLFCVPTLPKDIYLKLTELRHVLTLTQWQVILLGVKAILLVGKELGEDRLVTLADEVRGAYKADAGVDPPRVP